MLLDCKTVCVS